MSLTQLVVTLLSKKDQCVTEKQKVKFIKLALNIIWWAVENFTIDFTFEYLQCIQVVGSVKNIGGHFDHVVKLLQQFLEKISVNNGGLESGC